MHAVRIRTELDPGADWSNRGEVGRGRNSQVIELALSTYGPLLNDAELAGSLVHGHRPSSRLTHRHSLFSTTLNSLHLGKHLTRSTRCFKLPPPSFAAGRNQTEMQSALRRSFKMVLQRIQRVWVLRCSSRTGQDTRMGLWTSQGRQEIS